METITQRKLRSRGHLKEHLDHSNYLSILPVRESNLLNIQDTDQLLEKLRSVNFNPKNKFYFNPSDELFSKIKEGLLELGNGSVYLLTEFSFDSGVHKLASITDFNWNFEFKKLGYYRVTLLQTDFSNIITFWEPDEDSFGRLEIEVGGINWITKIAQLHEDERGALPHK